RQAIPPIFEPGLEELLRMPGTPLKCTTKYSEAIPDADIIFIAVGTPSDMDGSPDMSYVHEAAYQIGLNLGPGYTLIVNKSTVPVGSGNWVDSIVQEALSSRNGSRPEASFSVASNPEFLREGTAIHDTFYADRIVVGSREPRAIAMLSELYLPLRNQDFVPPAFLPRPEGMSAVPLVTTDLASAEMIKYAANAFLTVKISFINEIARLAEKVGADVSQLSRGIGLDSRIGGRFLQAGIGWGGSCFGKDTAALSAIGREYGETMHIVDAARHVNCRQREWVVERILSELKILKGCTIGMLGVAFKPNTDDLRDAPALDIAKRLIGRGAKVLAHDPVALTRAKSEPAIPHLQYKDTPEEVFEGASALILATEWPEYRRIPYAELRGRMKSATLLDGRNFLDPEEMADFGYRYIGVGR
ncbi:MAG TPA: UDP-glucose/GDP-mannose dehydrogenase family protein, partial [Bryobacteraceae bacterium]